MEMRFYDYLACFGAICQVFSNRVGATRGWLGKLRRLMDLITDVVPIGNKNEVQSG